MTTFPLFLAGVLGLGGPEVILVLAVMMLLFGGSKLPELARGLGKSVKEFKNATRDDPEPAAAPTPAPAPAAAAPAPAAATKADTAKPAEQKH